MCRIAAYIGETRPIADLVTRPHHSLLAQSQHAEEAKLEVNGDGFGIGWYQTGDPLPGTYRDVMPAWADGNLTSLCRMVSAPLFIAHIRASTTGVTSRENCHPFTNGRWSFCHNGQVPHIDRIRRHLESQLSDALYNSRRGTTDSELIFLTLLQNGLDHDVESAWVKTMKLLQPSAGDKPVRLTCVFSNGESLFAYRSASDGKCPTLYVSEECGGQTLASEPLCGDIKKWRAVPTNSVFRLDKPALASV